MPATLVIDGHPNADSLTTALARRYVEAHGDAQLVSVRDLDFDVHLRHGYRAHMPLEPDLERVKHALHDAKRIVVATPLWWGSVPALLQGFFDRALLPREEYRYTPQGFPVGLLSGRRGRVLLLADTPRLLIPVMGAPAARAIRRNTLGLCGVKPAPVSLFAGVGSASADRIAGWFDRVARLAERDAQRDSSRVQPERQTHSFADASA